jgi:dTMP kinase
MAAERRAAVRAPDRFESQDLAFFERVHAGYERRAASTPSRFVRVDARPNLAVVWSQIEAAVAGRSWW